MEEAFAVVREAAWRILELRHYDVQLLGGMVLHEGRLAQMATGEGKTLAATLPTYLNALEGKGALVVTFNEYLAKRDAETVGLGRDEALRQLDGGRRLITDASGWLLSSPTEPSRLKKADGARVWLDGRMRRCAGPRDDPCEGRDRGDDFGAPLASSHLRARSPARTRRAPRRGAAPLANSSRHERGAALLYRVGGGEAR